jgi:anthranilate phosphoribosyltransferase
MKVVAPIRKALGVRTAFNILGPLTNAAGAEHVLLGVFDSELVDLMGGALLELGQVEHAVVVHGCGLDEISPMGASTVFELRNTAPRGEPKTYVTSRYSLDPLTLGVPRCTVEDIRGGDAEYNANAMREVLAGGAHTDARRDSVVLNAGMGCYVYGLAPSVAEGVQLAREVLASGKALRTLDQWVSSSQENCKLGI